MKTIKVQVDEKVYAELVAERKAAGVPSVAALLLKKAGKLTDDAAAQEIVKRAMIQAKKQNGRFTIKGLFTPSVWEGFPVGARLRAARQFNARVLKATDGIATAGKASSGHQLYQHSTAEG